MIIEVAMAPIIDRFINCFIIDLPALVAMVHYLTFSKDFLFSPRLDFYDP